MSSEHGRADIWVTRRDVQVWIYSVERKLGGIFSVFPSLPYYCFFGVEEPWAVQPLIYTAVWMFGGCVYSGVKGGKRRIENILCENETEALIYYHHF